MDFSLTEEQMMLRDTIRNFSEKEIGPRVREMDEKGELDSEVVKKLGEMGLLGILFPPEYNGAGYSYIDYVIILEELSKVDASVGLTVAAHNSLCANHIYQFGNETQKKKYLSRLAVGETLGAWGLTEPMAGSDVASIRTSAEKKGDYYILNGNKVFCTNGSVSDIYVVIAVTDKTKGRKGISSFILEKGMEGFKIGKKENKLGVRASDTAELIFEDVKVPKENLLGEEGRGFYDVMSVLDGGRISIAAFSLGIAAASLEASMKYAKERIQFGEPISNFQAIQWMIVDMATELDAARLLTYKSAYIKDLGKEPIKESSMAKYFAGELAVKASSLAVQIYGGYGFTKEFPVEKYYRDSKLCTIGEGTTEIQKLIIARQLLSEK
ncbi:MAG: acyl-CoA dehydrogenase [Acidobacteriota bacterium]